MTVPAEIDSVAYLEPSPAQPNGEDAVPAEFWRTTAPGAEAVRRSHTLERFWNLLDENGRYEHIYRMLLDCCANEGGATAQQMGDAVDSDPALQDPRLYASCFFSGLDACGLITWTVTELGRTAMDAIDARSANA